MITTAEAVRPQPVDDPEQGVDLLGCEGTGRLVEDHDPRLRRSAPGGVSTIWRSASERSRTSASGSTAQAEPIGRLEDPGCGRRPVVATVPVDQLDVLGHGERRDEAQVLEHHADSAGGGQSVGESSSTTFTVDADLALLGMVDPVQDLHQACSCRRRSRRAARGPRPPADPGRHGRWRRATRTAG